MKNTVKYINCFKSVLVYIGKELDRRTVYSEPCDETRALYEELLSLAETDANIKDMQP